MSDAIPTATRYREEAQDKRKVAEKVTDATQKKQLLREAEALEDLAQTLEEGAPG